MDRGSSLKRKPCPKDNAGFFSLLTFSYLLKFIHRGRKKEIEEIDLYNVMSTLQSKKLGDELERHWIKQKAQNNEASIISSLISCYGTTMLLLGIGQSIAKLIHLYTMPWALGKFVSYFEKDQTKITHEMACYYAGVMIVVNYFNGVWDQHFSLWKIELGIKMQAAMSSLMYRKSLTLSVAKLNEISTGKIITSIVKDVASLNNAIVYGIDLVLESFQVFLVCYMLYEKIGVGSLGGMGVLVISILLQVAVSKLVYVRRGDCNEKSDRRLQATQEVLSNIRLIKMYRWESFFKDRLTKIRRSELLNLQFVFVYKSISIILGIVSRRIAQISVFGLYMYLGNSLNAEIVYYVDQLFHKVSKAMIFIPLGIQALAEFMISLKRVNAILNAEENNIIYKSTIQMLKPEITFIGVDVNFGQRTILKNINLELKSGLNIMIGSSGGGKSTILRAILEEYKTKNGELKVRGTISYASQNPWLFPSSVKQNILFGRPYDVKKYKNIVDMCGLTQDFNTFENGDETILTDCGANLSRGQQCRINLARALYRDSDIYLLDDCLASLDIQIKNQVFNEAIKSYLKGKLCLLITHSTQFVNQAENVIVVANNTIKYSGKPSEIPQEVFQQIEQDQNDDVDETIVESADEENPDIEGGEEKCLLQKFNKVDEDNIYTEKKKKGRVNLSCYVNYFKFGGGFIMALVLVGLHVICEVTNGAGEKFMSAWVNEQTGKTNQTYGQISTEFSTIIANFTTNLYEDQNFTTQPTIFSDLENISTIFAELPTEKPTSSLLAFDMFTLFIATYILSTLLVVIRCFMTYYYTIKVSRNMHKSMITNILQASMIFFDTHLIGNVLTRFSRDLYITDEWIPFIWLEGFRLFFLLPISLVLIGSVSIMLAVVSAVLTILFYFICEYFLSTTRSTQRLSNSTLSPVIGHLNASLEGLMVVRAYGTQQILRDEFDKHQDLYISANHLREIAARSLGFYSHSIASVFTSVIIIGFLFTKIGALAGDVGLVLSQSTMLCMLLEYVLMLWMMMENNMTCVERALEYTKLPQESQTGGYFDDWPQKGKIQFQNVSLTYKTNGKTILRNLNFDIKPQEKIGIVGRTGAGKSSIIVTLFKMYDFAGDITIDNVNLKLVSLECLRTHLAIIPQDPVIFTGTVRTNIDPKGILNDDQVWKTLEVVNLKSCFKNLGEDIAGKNLSIGQKQLICLARALTRKSKIVILDEATANMDEEMDSFIQNKIRDLFQSSTVITVAHRLHTVRNCDRIIVMDKGEIVQFDTPQNLLNNTNGLFYKMVHQKNERNADTRTKKQV